MIPARHREGQERIMLLFKREELIVGKSGDQAARSFVRAFLGRFAVHINICSHALPFYHNNSINSIEMPRRSIKMDIKMISYISYDSNRQESSIPYT